MTGFYRSAARNRALAVNESTESIAAFFPLNLTRVCPGAGLCFYASPPGGGDALCRAVALEPLPPGESGEVLLCGLTAAVLPAGAQTGDFLTVDESGFAVTQSRHCAIVLAAAEDDDKPGLIWFNPPGDGGAELMVLQSVPAA